MIIEVGNEKARERLVDLSRAWLKVADGGGFPNYGFWGGFVTCLFEGGFGWTMIFSRRERQRRKGRDLGGTWWANYGTAPNFRKANDGVWDGILVRKFVTVPNLAGSVVGQKRRGRDAAGLGERRASRTRCLTLAT